MANLILVFFSHIISFAEFAFVCSEFDIFAHRPNQMSLLGTIENEYIPIALWIKTIFNTLYRPIMIRT